MCQHGMVSHLVDLTRGQLQARRKFDPNFLALYLKRCPAVAHVHEILQLVQRDEMFDPVAEPLGDQAGIVRKSLGSVARLPAALVLKRLRQVPVIERDKGLDPGFEQFIYQATIEAVSYT